MGLFVRHIKIGPAHLEIVELYYKNRVNAEKGEYDSATDMLSLKDDFGNTGSFKRSLIAADLIIDFDQKMKADEENAVSHIRAEESLKQRRNGMGAILSPKRTG